MQLRSRIKRPAKPQETLKKKNTPVTVPTRSLRRVVPREVQQNEKEAKPPSKKRRMGKLPVKGVEEQLLLLHQDSVSSDRQTGTVSQLLLETIKSGSKQNLELAFSQLQDLSSRNLARSYIELVNLILKCSGIPVSFPVKAFSCKKTLDDFQKTCVSLEESKDFLPVAVKASHLQKKDKQSIFSIIDKWWKLKKSRIFSDGPEHENFKFFTTVLYSLTTSRLRPLRRLSTLFAVRILTLILEYSTEVEKRLSFVSGEQPLPQGTQAASMGIRKKLAMNYTKYFLGIISPRYRDSDPVIRSLCLDEFGTWVKKNPARFLDEKEVEHLTWLLYDKFPFVRVECLKALFCLYNANSVASFVIKIIHKYEDKIFEVITGSTDALVRQEAVRLMALAAKNGILSSKHTNALLLLIFDINLQIRKQVADLFINSWKQDSLAQRVMKLEKSNLGVAAAQINKARVLSLCDSLLKVADLASKNEPGNTSSNTLSKNIDNSETKAKDIKDLITWFTYKCPVPHIEIISFIQVDTAISVLNNYPEIAECSMEMLNMLKESLKDKKPRGSKVEEMLSPSPIQILCIAYILFSHLSLLFSKQGSPSEKSKGLARGLLITAPDLLLRHAFDNNEKSRKLVEESLVFLKRTGINIICSMQAYAECMPLIESLNSIIGKCPSEEIITEASSLLECLMDTTQAKENSMFAALILKFSLQDPPNVGVLNTEVSLAARNIHLQLVSGSLKRISSEMVPPSKHSESLSLEELRILNLELIRIQRLLSISMWTPLQDLNNEMQSEDGLIFSSICSLLDYILTTSSLYSTESKNKSLQDYLLTSAAVISLEIIGLDTIWELWTALEEAASRFKSEVSNIDIKSLSLASRITALKSAVSREDLRKIPEKFLNKFRIIIKIAEAAVVGSSCDVPLDLPFRISAFKTLATLLMLSNGDSSILFTRISYIPFQDVQEKSGALFNRAIDALAFTKSQWYSSLLQAARAQVNLSAPKSTQVFYEKEVKHFILRDIADFSRLISYDIFDESQASLLFGHYGMPGVVVRGKAYEACHYGLVNPFGSVWDGIATSCATRIFGIRFSTTILTFMKSKMAKEDDDSSLSQFSNFISRSLSVFLNSTSILFKRYYTLPLSSDEAIVKLTRLLCKTMYSWSSVIILKEELISLKKVIMDHLIEFECMGIKSMLEFTREYTSDPSSTSRLKLLEFNKGWKIWVAVMNAIEQIHKVFYPESQQEKYINSNSSNGVQAIKFIERELQKMGYSRKNIHNDSDWHIVLLFEKCIPGLLVFE